ncbi:MAG: hypothetical protein QGG36_31590 [Pirellulaceae bacterium]|nr:hypothetical protein [Pirellulaceae bacterium]
MATRRALRRGYSILELVVALSASSMLLVGLASTMYVAIKIAETPTAAQDVYASSVALQQLADELQFAIHVVEQTDKVIEFAVADRDGDNLTDLIRYEWSGVAGAALVRTFNQGSAVDVVPNVQSLSLAAIVNTKDEEFPTTQESAETLFWSHTTLANSNDWRTNTTQWIGQYIHPNMFSPPLPSNAISWRPTKLKFEARKDGNDDGEMWLQLRQTAPDMSGDELPTSNIYMQQKLYETSLTSNYTWQTWTMTDSHWLGVSEDLAVVFQEAANDKAGYIHYDGGGGAGRVMTTASGASWTYNSDRAISGELYGKWLEPGTPITLTRRYLTGLRAVLQTGNGGDVTSQIQLLNSPELMTAFWDVDFSSDPTLVDANFDGVGDWARVDAQAFDTGSLSAGVWTIDYPLKSTPNEDFDDDSTFEISARHTNTVGAGLEATWNAEWSGSTCGTLIVRMQLQANSTQTVTVHHVTSGGLEELLVRTPGLSSGMVTVRLVTLPDTNQVNVKVAGVDQGAWTYQTRTPGHTDKYVRLDKGTGSTVEVDFASLRESDSE